MKKIGCALMALIMALGFFGCKDEANKENENMVDLMIFMGQSNMAGRGITSEEFPEPAPEIMEGAGYEFRAISDPTRLHPMVEPFGVNENKPGGISESTKTGSLVTAFANAYYKETKVPVVGVSASIGGTSIALWQPHSAYLSDAIQRLRDAKEYLEGSEYQVRHIYMVWCQGESDADVGVTAEKYNKYFNKIMGAMKEEGVEHCFMIQIGKLNIEGQNDWYDEMIKCQEDLAKENEDVTMVSTKFAEMLERGLMKDEYHYYQQGYNEVGTDAGTNAAKYVNSIK